ncbi:hypothetical protein [Kitasatospora sp. KL5]|uniref:hypothetical protein n=1 Tax=Kitasatospora sp. KL5 TaxID=3425125 RepID=UPI003D6F8EA6
MARSTQGPGTSATKARLSDLQDVPAEGRQACWQSVRRRLYVREPPGHEAHEYVSADGLVLLCVTEYC